MPDQNAPPPEHSAPPPDGPKWEHKTSFGITGQMKQVIELAMSASQAELKVLRRKLEKLQYGS